MLKKMYGAISAHGMVLMIIGFTLAVISLFVYMKTRYYGSAIPQVAFGFTIAGFIVYILGRFFLATARSRSRESAKTPPESKEE